MEPTSRLLTQRSRVRQCESEIPDFRSEDAGPDDISYKPTPFCEGILERQNVVVVVRDANPDKIARITFQAAEDEITKVMEDYGRMLGTAIELGSLAAVTCIMADQLERRDEAAA